jgi:hypothetical protein
MSLLGIWAAVGANVGCSKDMHRAGAGSSSAANAPASRSSANARPDIPAERGIDASGGDPEAATALVPQPRDALRSRSEGRAGAPSADVLGPGGAVALSGPTLLGASSRPNGAGSAAGETDESWRLDGGPTWEWSPVGAASSASSWPSIERWWVASAPKPAPKRECDGCMRLKTTPRRERPPVHVYVFTEVADDASLVRGGYGGHVVGDHFLVGGGGFGLTRLRPLEPARAIEAGPQRDSLGAGGFFGEVFPFPKSVVQPAAGVFVGLGNLSYKVDSTQPYPTTKLFVVAPQVTVEAKASDSIRFGVGASYRVLQGSDVADRLTRDVDGPSGFAFALFGYR